MTWWRAGALFVALTSVACGGAQPELAAAETPTEQGRSVLADASAVIRLDLRRLRSSGLGQAFHADEPGLQPLYEQASALWIGIFVRPAGELEVARVFEGIDKPAPPVEHRDSGQLGPWLLSSDERTLGLRNDSSLVIVPRRWAKSLRARLAAPASAWAVPERGVVSAGVKRCEMPARYQEKYPHVLSLCQAVQQVVVVGEIREERAVVVVSLSATSPAEARRWLEFTSAQLELLRAGRWGALVESADTELLGNSVRLTWEVPVAALVSLVTPAASQGAAP